VYVEKLLARIFDRGDAMPIPLSVAGNRTLASRHSYAVIDLGVEGEEAGRSGGGRGGGEEAIWVKSRSSKQMRRSVAPADGEARW